MSRRLFVYSLKRNSKKVNYICEMAGRIQKHLTETVLLSLTVSFVFVEVSHNSGPSATDSNKAAATGNT